MNQIWAVVCDKEATVIGPASFHDLPREATHDAVREPDPATLRAVVVSPLSAYTVPLQSTLLERPLAVVSLPALDRRVVMYIGEGLDLGTLGWDEESLPALVLESQDGDLRVRAVTTGDPDDDSLCVPCSAIFPSLITTILSASLIVFNL